MPLTKFNDYRYDPFLETDSAASISDERHVIPNASPYYIRLDEIPKLDDPSTIEVWTGVGKTGTQYSEVSSAPATQEFQVDYKHKTAKVRFNSANADTTVYVTYKGMGTHISDKLAKLLGYLPAGFNPNFVGDGSDGTPDYSAGGSITTESKQFANMNIPNGQTVTCTKKATFIGVQGTLTIAGTLSAIGVGGVGGLGASSPAGIGGVGDWGYPLVQQEALRQVLGGAGAGGGKGGGLCPAGHCLAMRFNPGPRDYLLLEG